MVIRPQLNTRSALAWLLVLPCVMLGQSQAVAQGSMPPGAFLRRHAVTGVELSREVHDDPLLLTRYSRTFHLPRATLLRAFAHLHVAPLREDRVYQVHYVHPGEQIGARLRRVRAGTPVFMNPEGKPVLVQVCGNPLLSGPIDELANPGAQTGRLSTVPDFEPYEPLGRIADSALPILGENRFVVPNDNNVPRVALLQPEVPLAAAIGSPILPPLLPLAHIGLLGSGLGAAAAAAGAAGAIGSIIPGGTPGPTPRDNSTPEPGTMSLLAATMVSWGAFTRRAKAGRRLLARSITG